ERTGMVVLSDIGDLENIHPGNKTDAGKRLAAWALHHDYGFAEMPFSGPLFRSYEIENGKVILHFDYANDGLTAREGELREFEILDETGKWIDAKARIIDNRVEVDPKVENPQGIRYAYSNDSNPNMFNTEGLPASCFEIHFNGINRE
ncbi:MAG: hypothetical protein JSV24_09545, partial [Bacteroidales bacterium]